MRNPILEIIDVTVLRGQSAKPALTDFHLSLYQGECVAVCGHNGAGKSTLARLLTGLCKPAKGELRVAGEASEANHATQANHANHVRMVFQNPAAQLVGDTVYEELAVTLLQSHPTWQKSDILEAATTLCQRVGLQVPMHTPLGKLSGGQLQRVCIAEALASGADILVLDEAFASLDPDTALHLRDEISRIAKAENKAILLITHDMEDVLAVERVMVIEQGHLVVDTDPATFFYGTDGLGAPAKAHGFPLPYVVQVANEVNRLRGTTLRPCSETALMEALVYGVSAS